MKPFSEGETEKLIFKAQYLEKWDEATAEINQYWEKLSIEDFNENFNLFGQYEFPVIQNILYFIDNEVHHRGQGYVYLRALGIEPPFFWNRKVLKFELLNCLILPEKGFYKKTPKHEIKFSLGVFLFSKSSRILSFPEKRRFDS